MELARISQKKKNIKEFILLFYLFGYVVFDVIRIKLLSDDNECG